MLSKVWRYYSAVCAALLVFTSSGFAAQAYSLDTSYTGASFFQGFDFFTGADPTEGFVNYVDRTSAITKGLVASGAARTAYIGVDHTTVLSPSGMGRNSVRISTKKSWTHGLFIADIKHMPGGICGTWPALWSFGPNWPHSGEIDIIEGVNAETADAMSLHTSANCTVTGSGQQGTLVSNNCDGNTDDNTGCSTTSSTSLSYGKGFNNINGGVYATEWTSQYIKIWFFPRTNIPADITRGTPNPSTWGLPQTNFQGRCNIDSHFVNHNIVLDNTFCGTWAGNVWSEDATCSKLAPTCEDYVASNPSAFVNAYWQINYINVYQLLSTSPPVSPGQSKSSVRPNYLGNVANLSSSATSPDLYEISSAPYPMPSSLLDPQLSDILSSAQVLSVVSGDSYISEEDPSSISLDPGIGQALGGSLAIQSGSQTSFDPGIASATEGAIADPAAIEVTVIDDVTITRPCSASDEGIASGLASLTSIDPAPSASGQAPGALFVDINPNITLSSDLISIVPSSILGLDANVPDPQQYVTVLTTTYIDICACTASTLTVYTLTTTITLTSYLTTTTAFEPAFFAEIPMTTTTKTCESCGLGGGNLTYTVTVPVTKTSTAYRSAPGSLFAQWSNGTEALSPAAPSPSGGGVFMQQNNGFVVVGTATKVVVLVNTQTGQQAAPAGTGSGIPVSTGYVMFTGGGNTDLEISLTFMITALGLALLFL